MSRLSLAARSSGVLLGCMTYFTLTAAELTLLDTPIKVTATLQALDEGGYVAQIGVHNGPIAQLVSTVVRERRQAAAESTLRKQLHWRAPYLFVHSSCASGRSLGCEGEVIFKVIDTMTTRLGDVIGTAPGIFREGQFFDVYDKLEAQVDGLSPAVSPKFTLVLNDVDGTLNVNAEATWSSNAVVWREQAAKLATLRPDRDWLDADWQTYMAALVSNAALARYCKKTDELQQLLNSITPLLDADRRRSLTDALSKVVPLERPKAWRVPY